MTNTLVITECQWLGQEQEGPRYKPVCSCAVVLGRAYCEEHLWRVYQKGTAVHRRKDVRTADSVHLWESLFNEAVEELENEGFL